MKTVYGPREFHADLRRIFYCDNGNVFFFFVFIARFSDVSIISVQSLD